MAGAGEGTSVKGSSCPGMGRRQGGEGRFQRSMPDPALLAMALAEPQ